MVPVLLAGTFVSHAKPNIKALTNSKNARTVESREETQIRPDVTAPTEFPDSIPPVAPSTPVMAPRIPSEVNFHSIGIGLGQTFLRSDLHDNGRDSITADLLYSYSASYSFDFMADLHYSKHEFQNRHAWARGLALGIRGKGYQIDAFSPYILGGLGFYLPKTERMVDGHLTQSETSVVFGIHAGVGVELRLNRNYNVGVLLHYHDPFNVRQEVGPEIEASYLKLLLTGMYSF